MQVVRLCLPIFGFVGLIACESDLVDRVQREHSVVLPPSVDNVLALGDASYSLNAMLKIDRGASSLFSIDRDKIDQLLKQINGLEDYFTVFLEKPFQPGDNPAPSNAVYQTKNVLWSKDTAPYKGFHTSQPGTSADYVTIFLYDINDETAGVWMYSAFEVTIRLT